MTSKTRQFKKTARVLVFELSSQAQRPTKDKDCGNDNSCWDILVAPGYLGRLRSAQLSSTSVGERGIHRIMQRSSCA